MDEKFIEKMEQWDILMNLMGITNYVQENGDLVLGEPLAWLYDEYTSWLARINDPDPMLTAVMRSIEMGVTIDNIEEYYKYRDEKERQALLEAMLQAELNNTRIHELIQQHNFEFFESKQYPKHTNFKFNMPAGFEVKGRAFRVSGYGPWRVWLSWRNKQNKTVKQYKNLYAWFGSDIMPSGFPDHWQNNRLTSDALAYIVAWRCTNNQLKKLGMTYPKQ